MANSSRDAASIKTLLENIKKLIPFQQAVVFTSVPRGGLQLAQPTRLPAGLLKAYAQGAHAEDRLTWQSILREKPVQPADCWPRESFLGSAYSREFMVPAGLSHVVALPLAGPFLAGYPGSLHLLRTKAQGAFTSSNIAAAMSAIRAFDQRLVASRAPRRTGSAKPSKPELGERPPTGLTIFDAKLRVRFGADAWNNLDAHLKEQMADHAKRRFGHLNTHGMTGDRAQFPDTVSNVWPFRVVTYKRYPAISDGPVSFFCLQPSCREWTGVKPRDFEADEELARLIPSLKYMAREYPKGPTLVSIANVAKLSPFHFHRRFTELLGMTPKQFMLDCQIDEAKSELLGGKTELADIARDCGFAHQSHFTSRFKQATGQTPTRWRRSTVARSKPSAKPAPNRPVKRQR